MPQKISFLEAWHCKKLIKFIVRDGFGPNFCGPRPIWADLLWAGPRLGPFLELDLWAWAGPGLSSFGLGWALGQIENQCWAKFGPF